MFTLATKGKREPHVSDASTLAKTDSQRDPSTVSQEDGLTCARAQILIVFSNSYLGKKLDELFS